MLTRRLRLLLEIATEIGPSLKLGAPLDTTLHTLVEALPEADTAAILLHDPQTDLLVPCAFVGLGEAYGRIRLRPGEGISGMAFLHGARLQHEGRSHAEALYRSLSAENAALLQEAAKGRNFHHSVAVPRRTQEDQVLGVLTLGSSRADFLGDDLRVLEGVAAQLAVALENAQLYGHVRHQADELATALAELKASQQQVVQQERLRALGQLASGIAHDLYNTLSPVMGFSELLLTTGEGLSHRQREWLSLIRTGAGDAAEVVRRLREFYRPRDIHDAFVLVDLAAVVEDTVALTRPKWKDDAQASGQTITLGVQLGQLPPVIGNPAELREALTNLIINAVDALPRGGSITVRTCARSGSAVLEVIDTGDGMSEDVRKKCVE
ncbi:MAG TPA: HAMP domain-containing sensor histidine kinase, partial [Chloroflexota bacterium]|nr:HAMP domain-containing sensor histidine kinase [Chloroflexota bacterium]